MSLSMEGKEEEDVLIGPKFSPPLYQQRYNKIVNLIKENNAKRVGNLTCLSILLIRRKIFLKNLGFLGLGKGVGFYNSWKGCVVLWTMLVTALVYILLCGRYSKLWRGWGAMMDEYCLQTEDVKYSRVGW